MIEKNTSLRGFTGNRVEDISRYILLALVFILPIFFIPSTMFPFQFSKLVLVSIGAILSFILWIISRFKAGSFKLPKHIVFYSILAIIFFGLISTLFSGSIAESFWGARGEVSTLFFTIVLFILMFVSFNIFRSPERVLNLYLSLFASSLILIIYQILRFFFGADFLDFGILNLQTSTLLGRWNDLGIFSGLLAFISVATLEFFKPTKLLKVLLYVSTGLSLALVAVVNSTMVWIVLAVSSLLLFVHLYLQKVKKEVTIDKEEVEISSVRNKVKKFSRLSLSVIVIAIIFIVLDTQVATLVSEKFNISNIEARPSFVSTLEVAQKTLTQSPGFGAGPNRFAIEWGINKPNGVNNTIFWNANFGYGVGVIPTSLITNGVLGFLSWVVFLGALLFLGLKSLFSVTPDPTSRFVVTSSFLATLYLWIFSIISVPGIVIVFITYLMTGVFVASVASLGFVKYREISLSDDSKTGFISVFSLIVILIINVGFVYAITTKYASSVYAQKAITEVNQNGSLDTGIRALNRSLILAKTDSNYRLMSQLHIARLNAILNDQNLAGTEEGTSLFQEVLGDAISSAQLATRVDEADYRNWMSLGNIYEAIIPLRIQGAYENAKGIYEIAMDKNPTNPSIDLALARLEVANGNNDEARVRISNSLRKKNNYTDAIFLLSQIEINEGNIEEATQAVEAASLLTPNDPLTFFQLGFLKFNQRNFEDAIEALERAVELNPPYSNAKYFLGLSYYNANRIDEAILQFEDIETLNPDNGEVKNILNNLRAGNQPFFNVKSASPEDREELPVKTN